MPRNRAEGRPALDEPAFRRLLQWLDEGRESHGERYVEIRERLVTYFARRNGPAPDDLADEALNRVARRLQEQGAIDDVSPAHYCYIVARFVLLESLRERNGSRQPASTTFAAQRRRRVRWTRSGRNESGPWTVWNTVWRGESRPNVN